MKYPFAHWTPAHSNNFSTTRNNPKFVVVHVICGSWTGCKSWFENPNAGVSAHFSISKLGEVNQHVDTDHVAYAEMAWNDKAISIEHEGHPGDHLTLKQIAALDALLEWIHSNYKIPLVWTNTGAPGHPGVISHGLLGVEGGNHISCPGAQIVADVKHLLDRKNGNHADPELKPDPTPSKDLPVIKLGSRGEAVKTLQRALHIKIDGIFGPQTNSKVLELQKSNNIEADGIVGPITWQFVKRLSKR